MDAPLVRTAVTAMAVTGFPTLPLMKPVVTVMAVTGFPTRPLMKPIVTVMAVTGFPTPPRATGHHRHGIPPVAWLLVPGTAFRLLPGH